MKGHFCLIKSPIFAFLPDIDLSVDHLLYEKQSLLVRALFPTTFLVIYFVYDILFPFPLSNLFPLYQGCQTHFSSGATWRKIYSRVGRTGKIMA